jgi:hypothetical protein
MGFDDEGRGEWGGGGGNHSRMTLLRIAVECGAIQTGYVGGTELPYYGVHEHCLSLVADGLLKKYDGIYRATYLMGEETIWVPTENGKILCK